MNKLYLISGISWLCVACSVGPDYQKQEFFNEYDIKESIGVRQFSNNEINQFWYYDFFDNELNQLIDLGLKHNHNINIAIENMKQARLGLYNIRSGFAPKFDIGGSYNKDNQNFAGSFPIKAEYYQLGIDASWEIDIWGKRRRMSESAEALLEAIKADFNNVKISLTAEISTTYIKWRLAQKQLEIMNENLKLQKEIFEIVASKYKSGLADDLAYEQAKSILNSTEMQIPKAQMAENTYFNALAVLVGELPANLRLSANNILNQKFKIELDRLYNLPTNVIRNRPDIKALEQNMIAKNAQIGQAIAELYPNVSLSGFLGYQNNTLSPIFGADYNMYSMQGNLLMPLLHWGELINNVKIKESVSKQAMELYKAGILNAVAEISNAINNVKEEDKRNIASQKNQKSAQEILALSLKKYRNGLIDFSDLLTAEQDNLEAEQELVKSNADIYINIVSFYKAVGGGLDIKEENNTCNKGQDYSS